MSRLGRTPIAIPKGVEIKVGSARNVAIKGPKGELTLELPEGLTLEVENEKAILSCDENEVEGAFYGLYRSLLSNQVLGVSTGFEVRLTMVGVGYRAAVQGSKLDLQVGFSHPTALEIPKSLQITVEKGTTISIKGIDKREVGQFAATVRGTRPPEPYKGKGIRYENEYVRKKEGKAAKGKAG